jgi:L-malate glycosyltransferase
MTNVTVVQRAQWEMKTKVLVVIKGMGIGGAERLISEGSRFWSRDRFDYRVAYLLPWKDALVPDLAEQGIPVECFGTTRLPTFRALQRLRKLCRQADVVHSHLPLTGVLSRVVVPNAVHVYTEHNLTGSYTPATRWANRLTYGRNAAAVAVSQSVADSTAGYPGHPVRVIPNGVAPLLAAGSVERVRHELRLEADEVLVVHVGNIRPGKGHDALVEAVSAAISSDPRLVFVSIGSEKVEGDLARLRAKTDSLGLDGHLRFLGPRPDALDFTGAADIYVNPSEVEGLPVAILEAMALGRPVVATAVGGVPTVVKHGLTGYLVEASDPAGLAERIVELAADPIKRSEMGGRGEDLVQVEFSLERMVEAYEALYEEVMS